MIKVTLISYTRNPLSTIAAAVNQCYSAKSGAELKKSISFLKKKKLLDIVISAGHHSTIEHASFTFAIEGISRACSHQLVRHRIASYNQQSQRYVKFKNGKFLYVVPPRISANKNLEKKYSKAMKNIGKLYFDLTGSGVKMEDARYLLPNACETKLVATFNARSLLNFFEHRLCTRAQWEIRKLAGLMLKEAMKAAPYIFKYAGPTCETEKICWEGSLSCGKWKGIKGGELRKRKTKK